MHHALDRIAADVAGNAGVGDGAARPDHAAERVAAHRLHNGVAVRSGGEARADADDARSVGDGGAEILLGEDRVHDHVRMKLFRALRLRIDDHRQDVLFKQPQRIGSVRGKPGVHLLDLRFAAVYRLGKADGAADGRRLRKIGHHNVDPRAPEPQRNAGGNVSGAFYHYEHSLFPLEMVLNPV